MMAYTKKIFIFLFCFSLGFSTSPFDKTYYREIHHKPRPVFHYKNPLPKKTLFLRMLCFPFWKLHSTLGGLFLIRSSAPKFWGIPHGENLTRLIADSVPRDMQLERFSINVNGMSIDGMKIIHNSNSKRWVCVTNGMSQPYNFHLLNPSFFHLLRSTDSNAVLFDYPGVGKSSGFVSLPNLIESYKGVLAYMQDQKQGLKAKELILWGYSMGGGVQAQALQDPSIIQKGVKCFCIKDRTYHKLSEATRDYFQNSFLKNLNYFLIRSLQWEIHASKKTLESSFPQIIIQSCHHHTIQNPPILHTKEQITHDRVISQTASLAYHTLQDSSKKDLFCHLASSEDHNNRLPIQEVDHIVDLIHQHF